MLQPGFKGLLLAEPAPLARLVSPATASHCFSSSTILSAPSSAHHLCGYTCSNSLSLDQKIKKMKMKMKKRVVDPLNGGHFCSL